MRKAARAAFRTLGELWTRYARAHCALHAAGLTYFSMFALMPLLCVVLLCAKACGAGDYVLAQVDRQAEVLVRAVEEGPEDGLVPLALPLDAAAREERRAGAQAFARQARALTGRLRAQMDRFDARALGWIGCLLLVWTVVGSIGMVEVSFNQIWGVKKVRAFWRRIGLYLLLAFLLPPLLALSAAPPLAKLAKDAVVLLEGPACPAPLSTGLAALVDSRLVRFVATTFFMALVFAALYKIIPNCPVRTRNAWRGGLFAALVLGAWMKLCAVLQIGIARASMLYGSFALFPLLLAGLYMGWQIVLLGAVAVRMLEARRTGR
ncbi:MAG TPA: hypothetical protein DD637_01185 [Verrucomicrobia bacterium]|nr:hypothetical protein [Verrucomicrobiota bacterium]